MKPIHDLEIKNLLKMAREAQDRAYAPYSKFRVGCVVKGASGAYYCGSNVENASYSLTVCAERVALYKAIYEGEKTFDAVAILSDSDRVTVPCGACRQVFAEFIEADTPIVCASKSGEYEIHTLADLYPNPFLPDQVK